MEMPENLPSSIWAVAWCKLYEWFSENERQEDLDLMKSILQGVITQAQEEIQQRTEDDHCNYHQRASRN